MIDHVSEDEFHRAGILMAAYGAVCGAAFVMTILLALLGDSFVAVF